MKYKRIKTIICLIMCIVMLSGCASVNYYTEVKEDTGEVVQSFSVQLDESAIITSNANLVNIENKLYSTISNYIYTLKTSFIYRDDGHTVMEKESWLISNAGQLKNFEYNVYKSGNYAYLFTLNFASIYAYAFFYDIDLVEHTEDYYDYQQNPFFDTKIETTQTIYNNLENSTMLTAWENTFKEEFNNMYSSNDIKYSFAYLEKNAHIRSDADEVVYKDGYYYHVYNMSLSETSRDIHFYNYTIKKEAWYISALILTFIVLIVLFIIKKIKILKENKIKKITDTIFNSENNNINSN